MSAVAEKEYVFYATGTSRSTPFNLQVVLEPRVTSVSPVGDLITHQEGLTVDFGRLRGFFHTSDPELAERLRAHPEFGVLFQEDVPVLPTEQEFSRMVARALAQADLERLVELKGEEVATHARPNLLTLVEGAIEGLGAELHDPASGDAHEGVDGLVGESVRVP